MRITKNNNTTSTQRRSASVMSASGRKNNDPYSAAEKHIRCAIDCLGKEATDSVLAKESIANLSVVLFDIIGK